jgi:hypothetical protein
MTAERDRLLEVPHGRSPWRRWGPYLSERAWGTAREDHSGGGDAWEFFPHDHARSRAYRWNEDGLAGIRDDRQTLCFALAFWNGTDPILKERIFGLTGPEGNHGEDAKEYWFYLDSTPTHSWMRWRYMYPQAEFPYQRLIDEHRARGKFDPEFELIDTGTFHAGGYWEITAEYAKRSPEEILIRVNVRNAGPEAATLEVCRRPDGTRPVFANCALFQRDPAWNQLIPFHEYFHGDTGAGLGASHQTGWTGLVADLIIRRRR